MIIVQLQMVIVINENVLLFVIYITNLSNGK